MTHYLSLKMLPRQPEQAKPEEASGDQGIAEQSPTLMIPQQKL